MIDRVLAEGRRQGFAVVEVFREKVDRREFEMFAEYEARHRIDSDIVTVRSFWEKGDPSGFSLSNPKFAAIRRAFQDLYVSHFPRQKNNFSHALPRRVRAATVRVYDPAVTGPADDSYRALGEKLDELPALFPGLVLKKVRFSQLLKKVYIANSLGLRAKYKKTLFNLILQVVRGDSVIAVNESRCFFDRIDPVRMVSRAGNLLGSLTDNTRVGDSVNSLILSPETAAYILREFSRHFIAPGDDQLKRLRLPQVLNLVDDATLDGQPGSVPFDDEGVSGGETWLIRRGGHESQIADLGRAFRFQRESTGNGYRSERFPFPAPRFSNLVIRPSVLPLRHIMREAGSGILLSLVKLKTHEADQRIFSAYGYRFHGEEVREPVHIYLRCSARSFFLKLSRVSREIRYFHSVYNVGSPYLLFDVRVGKDGTFDL